MLYSRLRTYSGTEEELRLVGQPSVKDFVVELNRRLQLCGRPKISQGDYPTSRTAFRRLLIRWERVNLKLAEIEAEEAEKISHEKNRLASG